MKSITYIGMDVHPVLSRARAQEYLEGTGTNKEGSAIYDLMLMALL